MSNLLLQNIKHTNNTTAQTIDTSGRTTVSIMNNDSTYRSDNGAATQNLVQGLAKAFVSIDVSAEDSFSSSDEFNIASVTDGGTGIFNIVFTNNMATARYSAPGGCYSTGSHIVATAGEATTGTSVRPVAGNDGSATDVDCYVTIHGTMA